MTKTETKQAKAEISKLKKALTTRGKHAAKTIAAHRKTIRANEREISLIESDLARFTKATTDRIAIIEGRLGL